ncbi:MAG TPA: cyanophycin synthetase [Pyrinomonadaceae bacterium]|nr:cyanophycin synthetase [Pyrinomonadaceae bacterium]
MTFDEAVQYLLSLGHETLAVKLGLANVARLLDALGSPQQSFPAVQIAGTNGKGSTAAFLDSVCHAAGIRAGLYTSPHLVSVTERVRVAGREIARDEFARQVARVREAALQARDESGALPSFFEQTTAAALSAFRDAGVGLAVLETGLGGRLDAVTAAGAGLVCVTPVALDHQEYLGQTLREIASEKAAVVREGVCAVVGPQDGEALEVILARCRECGVVPRRADEIARRAAVTGVTADGRFRVTFRTGADVYENVTLALRGRHQIANAACALAVAEELRERGFSRITRGAVVAGLESAEHAGRLELLSNLPPVLLDGAHNPAGARALRDYMDEFVRAPMTVVFGAMRDKELTEIAATIFPAAARLILTRADNPRSAEPETLAPLAARHLEGARITLARTAAEALRLARELTPPGGLVCVTGSLYLVGEARALLTARGFNGAG